MFDKFGGWAGFELMFDTVSAKAFNKEKDNMRILITGGTGLIGRPLSASLAADGHEVIVLSRNPIEVTSPTPEGVHLHRWDGRTSEGWLDLADGADGIVNLAGAGIADGRWTQDRKKLIRESRIAAGQAMVEVFNRVNAKPAVLVQASAVGYYGTYEDDSIVTEKNGPGTDYLAKVCFDWEISSAPVSRMGVRRPIARTGVVLSNDGGAFPKLKLPFTFFAGGKLGNGRQWLPWIHIHDQVRAIRFLLENDQADGPFNIAAPNPVTNEQAADALGKVMGRPSFLPAPAFAMKAALGEMATVVLDGQRAVPEHLQELGFSWVFPNLDEALQNLVEEKQATAEAVPA